MFIIHWWRVRRAYALLRFTFGLRYGDANVAMARIAVDDMRFRGHAAPSELLSAIAVIESGGRQRPAW
jgi:hypothetical protein